MSAPLPAFAPPPEDRELSPFTGWTRAHWEAVGLRWLDQVERFASPGGAAPRLPGRVTADGERRESMEAIGRSFLLAAPVIAGTETDAADRIRERYARALLAGTDPDGAEAWPLGVQCRAPVTGVTNSIVEAANIAFGLHIAGERLWGGLTRPEQRRIAAWLRHHARLEVWHNNWQLFPAMAEGFLRSVGEDASGAIGARNVARVESWYLEQGWYTDGPEHAVDYYNAWAIHPYLWAWHRMTGSGDIRHLERLYAFTESFADLVAADGSPVHIGRSLTYRTAVLAALWCAEMSGANALFHGTTRRLASGVLRRFVDAGVGIDEPLGLGWLRPHEPIAQTYSGFGSSYLAGIGFLGLALPADAPVWTEPERAQPADGAPGARAIAGAGWIVVRQSDGIVRLANHGTDHCEIPVEPTRPDPDDPHYAKLGYSSHTAPGTGRAWEDGVDGHLALIADDGRASRRGVIRAMRVEGAIAGSVHIPQRDGRPLPGCAVMSVTIVHGDDELRIHLVLSDGPRSVREGGWAVADDRAVAGRSDGRRASVTNTAGLSSAIIGLHGWARTEVVEHDGCDAFARFSAVPVLRGETDGSPSVFASLHALSRRPRDPSGGFALDVDGTVVTARWDDGAVHVVDVASFVPWDGVLAR
ncbi:DUF2264 domain-containing protein [Microbacterium sp. NPDC055683]